MSNWIRKLFSHNTRPITRRANPNTIRLGLEGLGTRVLPTVSSIELTASVLIIRSDDNGSAVDVKPFAGRINIYDGGRHIGTSIASNVVAIEFRGGNGNDSFTNATTLPSSLYGNGGYNVLTGGSARDYLYGGNSDDTLNGGGGNDYLYGNGGNDRLTGEAGDDSMFGGDGNDTYLFDADAPLGIDTVVDNSNANSPDNGGVDTLDFGSTSAAITLNLNAAYQDVNTSLSLYLEGTRSLENIVGGEGNDMLVGNEYDNVLGGSGGNDTLKGMLGNDTLNGGTGNDTLLGMGGDDTLGAKLQGFNQVGEDGDDMLIGGFDNDTLRGGDGSDTLWGGAGDDALRGWTGDDRYMFDPDESEGYNSIQERAGNGNDTLDFSAGTLRGVNLSLANAFRKQQLADDLALIFESFDSSASEVENVVGTQVADGISGDNAANKIDGLGGNDDIRGGGGNDNLIGGEGNDQVWGESGNDWIQGNNGDDTLNGGYDDDYLSGGAGNDTMGYWHITNGQSGNGPNITFYYSFYDEPGNDILDGGEDNDTVRGGSGDDQVWGGSGNDTLGAVVFFRYDSQYGNDKFLVLGEDGNDTLHGGANDDTIRGGWGNDVLYGDAGNDWLGGVEVTIFKGSATKGAIVEEYGEDGDDTLFGGSGHDVLWGGKGKDVMDGGGQRASVAEILAIYAVGVKDGVDNSIIAAGVAEADLIIGNGVVINPALAYLNEQDGKSW